METNIGSAPSPIKGPTLVSGHFLTTDLDRARRFYSQFLGFECVRHKKDALLIREPSTFPDGRPKSNRWVLEVTLVDEIPYPQGVLNHWGIDVADQAEVDRLHQKAQELKATFGIRRVQKPKLQHNVYAFYLEDGDRNWWEIQQPAPGYSLSKRLEKGDLF